MTAIAANATDHHSSTGTLTGGDAFGRHSPGGLPSLLLALGTGRLGGRLLGPVVRRAVPWLYGSVIDVTMDGLRRRLHVRAHADDRRQLALPRSAAQVRARIAAVLPSDGVFVDVGAGTGLHTLAAARHLDAPGRVVAVEPNAATRHRLAVNLALNPLAATVSLLDSAVGPACDDVILPSKTFSRAPAAWDAPPPALTRARPLLTLVEEAGLTRVDVLRLGFKAGADMALIPFLQAAPPALRPRLIVVERRRSTRWAFDLPATLALHGYHPCGGATGTLLFAVEGVTSRDVLWEPSDWSLVAS
ncbi:MAG: FkbM family methyltransferase [Azospirillaceae bacterium]|nr:FkbM family methyltransferase [Azospirillaceae bacterium]